MTILIGSIWLFIALRPNPNDYLTISLKPVDKSEFTLDGFAEDAVFEEVDRAVVPQAVQCFGSRIHDDHDRGRLESPWYVSNGDARVFVSGYPNLKGNSLVVEFADGATAPIAGNPMERWVAKRLDVEAGKRFKLKASDDSEAHGGWLGVSSPVKPSAGYYHALWALNVGFTLFWVATAALLIWRRRQTIVKLVKEPSECLRGFLDIIPTSWRESRTVVAFACLIVFLASLYVHLQTSLFGWGHLLLDNHGFRQTQTAITTYFAMKDGFQIDYATPVLGAPWSIPFEFPVYQWIVALISIVFRTPLDQTGRFVGLAAFYLSLIPLFFLLRFAFKEYRFRLVALSFVLLNPIYLFWPRTFMIESTAVCLSLFFLWMCAKTLETRKSAFIVAAAILGTVAALTKITTFFVFSVAALFFFIWFWYRENRRFHWKTLTRYCLYGIVIVGVPVAATRAWVARADYLKNENPLARNFINSAAIENWNYGTLEQRFEEKTWTVFNERSFQLRIFGQSGFPGGPLLANVIIVFALYFVAVHRRLLLMLALAACYLAPMLVFCNLYFVHDYYFFANSIFLSVLIGTLLSSVIQRSRPLLKFTMILLVVPVLLHFSYNVYEATYRPMQDNDAMRGVIDPIVNIVKEHSNPDDVIYVHCYWDWNPAIPYYCRRKAIMDRPFPKDKIRQALESTGKNNVKLMIVNENDTFLRDKASLFDFDPHPIFSNGGVNIYKTNWTAND